MDKLINGEIVAMTDTEEADFIAEQTRLGPAAAWAAYQASAKLALDDSDLTVLRCMENGVAVPAEWVSYRKSLRAIVGAASGEAASALPARPAYPTGT